MLCKAPSSSEDYLYTSPAGKLSPFSCPVIGNKPHKKEKNSNSPGVCPVGGERIATGRIEPRINTGWSYVALEPTNVNHCLTTRRHHVLFDLCTTALPSRLEWSYKADKAHWLCVRNNLLVTEKILRQNRVEKYSFYALKWSRERRHKLCGFLATYINAMTVLCFVYWHSLATVACALIHIKNL